MQVQPGQRQVVAVELEGFSVVMQVKVSIAQLTVDGTQHLQVLRAHLHGSFKEGDARSVVACFTEPLALQRQLQAGHLHPTVDRTRVSLKVKFKNKIKQNKIPKPKRLDDLLWVKPTAKCLNSGSKVSF